MYTKKTAGLSYLEIIISFGIFMMVAAIAFPTISQSALNMEAAMEHYAAHRNANSIKLAVRDAPNQAQSAALSTAARMGADCFTVWLSNTIVATCGCGPHGEMAYMLSGFYGGYASSIVVAVWNEYGNVIGRAFGIKIGED